tara:strand:- start:868 stop:1449 length:582 start_codon:yes stop_codon:yes gene_type:complete
MANRSYNKTKNRRNGRYCNTITSSKSISYKKVDKSTIDANISTISNWVGNQDMIHVQIHGQLKNRKFVQNVCELLLENIIPTKLRRNVDVDVWIYNAVEEQAGGYCWGDKRQVEIEIARTSEGYRYTREELLTNLTHELIHAKQFIAGELSPTNMRWKKADYTKVPYSQQPWEREAYRWEKRLYEKYFKKLGA